MTNQRVLQVEQNIHLLPGHAQTPWKAKPQWVPNIPVLEDRGAQGLKPTNELGDVHSNDDNTGINSINVRATREGIIFHGNNGMLCLVLLRKTEMSVSSAFLLMEVKRASVIKGIRILIFFSIDKKTNQNNLCSLVKTTEHMHIISYKYWYIQCENSKIRLIRIVWSGRNCHVIAVGPSLSGPQLRPPALVTSHLPSMVWQQ